MGDQIVQEVKLKYVVDGVKDIKDLLKTSKKFLNSKDAKAKIKLIENEMKGLIATINKGGMSSELMAQMEAKYKKLLNTTDGLRKHMMSAVSKELQADMAKAEGVIKKVVGELKAAKMNSSKTAFGLKTDKKGKTVTSDSAKAKFFDKESPGLLGASGEKAKSYATAVAMKEKIETIQKNLTIETLKTLEAQRKGEEVTKKAKALAEQELALALSENNIKMTTVAFEKESQASAAFFAKEDKDIIDRKNAYKEKGKQISAAQGIVDQANLERDKVALAIKKEKEAQGGIKGNEGIEIQKNIQAISKLTAEYNHQQSIKNKKTRENTELTNKNTTATTSNSTSIGKAAKNILNYGLAIQLLRRVYRETIKTIKELDSALTEMAIVTQLNRKET